MRRCNNCLEEVEWDAYSKCYQHANSAHGYQCQNAGAYPPDTGYMLFGIRVSDTYKAKE